MGVKKSKPTAVRLYEIKINTLVEKAYKSLESSKALITQSKGLTKASKKLIDKNPKRG